MAVLAAAGLLLTPARAARPEPARAARGSSPEPTQRPLLWKIERSPASYLYGTIHVPDPRVLARPPSVQRALERSNVIYTEIPLDAQTQLRALGAMSLPAGETLATALPPELHERATRYLAARGLALALFERHKPWVLATLLPMLDYVGRGPPLDQQIHAWAQSHGKRSAGLETIEMQVQAIESAGREGELALLRETLEYLENAAAEQRHPLNELIEIYLAGDEERIANAAFAYVDRSDPLIVRVLAALIDQRNAQMSEAIAQRLSAEPSQAHFFAVGAMHYPGEQGILAQLRARGLEISRVR
jgi:uncharacterized protein YbaP (TraB family)